MTSTINELPEGPGDEAIAKRAYELYLQRGSVPGYELDDWLAAKAELTAAAATARPIVVDASQPIRPSGAEPVETRHNGPATGRRATRQPQRQ